MGSPVGHEECPPPVLLARIAEPLYSNSNDFAHGASVSSRGFRASGKNDVSKYHLARISSVLPSILTLLFVTGYLVTAYRTMDADSRMVPILASYMTLFLLGIDLFTGWSRSGAKARTGDSDKDEGVPVVREVKVLLSIIGLVAGIYLVGFHPAIFVYLLVSLTCLGHQSLAYALVTALLSSAAIYLIFELGLSFQLFPGILFS